MIYVKVDGEWKALSTIAAHEHPGGTVEDHELDSDPHSQYLTEGDGDIRYVEV